MQSTAIELTLKSWRALYDGDRHLGEKGEDTPGPQLNQVEFNTLEAINRETKINQANNFLICELSHTGAPHNDATKSTPIFGRPGTRYQPEQALFTFSQLLKSSFRGEALLKLSLIDVDPNSKAGRFFRKVLAASMGTLLGGPIGGISGVLAAATANELSSMLGKEIEGNQEDEIRATIMEAKPMVVSSQDGITYSLSQWDSKANQLTNLPVSENREITLPFYATAEVVDLVRSRIAGRRGTHAIERRRITRYPKNSILGEAVIQLG